MMIARIVERAPVGVSLAVLGFTALWTLPRIALTVADHDRFRDEGAAGLVALVARLGLHIGLFAFLVIEAVCSVGACAPDAAAIAVLVLTPASAVVGFFASLVIAARRRRSPQVVTEQLAGVAGEDDEYVDPGWGRGLASAFTLRGVLRTIRVRPARVDGLVAMRAIYLGMVSAIWMILLVLIVIQAGVRPGPLGPWPYIVALVGIVTLSEVQRRRSQPLDGSSPERAAASYRGWFFIGVGLAESSALLGLVAAFETARLWPYALGLAFSTVSLLLLAPSRQDIVRRQEQLAEQGSTVSLGRALQQPPAAWPRRR